MLVAGEIAAAIGVQVDSPDVKPLIPKAREAGLQRLRERRPLPHQPHGGREGRPAGGESGSRARISSTRSSGRSRLYVERLKSGEIEEPAPADETFRRVMEITGDPLPYGIAPNRRELEAVIQYSLEQGILSRPMAVEDLFPANTHGLVG